MISHRILDICEDIRAAGGRALIVGGWVRDRHLGIDSKDVDIEVHGLDPDALQQVLSLSGQVDMVGAAFGVFRIHGLDVDFSLPRRDSKVGTGHQGFHVETDAHMGIAQAAARRDFTINTLAFDPLTGETFDTWAAGPDFEIGRLMATSDQFIEDPLRVLRGMQFAARFDMWLEAGTVSMCRGLLDEAGTLATERVWTEFWKMATRGRTPSRGMQVLLDTRWVELWPEVLGLVGIPQDSEWHPEGDVWRHTCMAMDAAAEIADREGLGPTERAVLVFGALCHDMGKGDTTVITDDGRIVSPGHASVSGRLAETFMVSVGAPAGIVRQVVALVDEHMFHIGDPGRRGVRRLVQRLGRGCTSVRMLAWLVEADHSARPPLAGGMPEAMVRVMAMADEIGAVAGIPDPLVMGRHLLPLGWDPGPGMGRMLQAAHAAQMEGVFDTVEDGIAWVMGQE